MSTPLSDHIVLVDELQFAVRESFCGPSGFSRVHAARTSLLATLAQPAIAAPVNNERPCFEMLKTLTADKSFGCLKMRNQEAVRELIAAPQPTPATSLGNADTAYNLGWSAGWSAHGCAYPETVVRPVEASSEPVAFVNGDELDDLPDGRAVLIQSDKDGWRGTPLYKEPPVVLCPLVATPVAPPAKLS